MGHLEQSADSVRSLGKALPLILLMLPFNGWPQEAAFMKVPNIPGEAQSANYEDWIGIQFVSTGVERLTVDQTVRSQHSPMILFMQMDRSVPLLLKAASEDAVISQEIILESNPIFLQGPKYTFHLYNTSVDSILLADSVPGQTAEVLLRLSYTYAEWHVRQYLQDGTLIDEAATFFDAGSGQSDVISSAPRILQPSSPTISAGSSFSVDLTVLEEDTNPINLQTELLYDTDIVEVNPLEWVGPETLRLSGTVSPAFEGETTITLRISDESVTASMSFAVYVDSSGTPWGGYLDAYFSPEEQSVISVSGPLADPDADGLSNLMEFLFGTNPLEPSRNPFTYEAVSEPDGSYTMHLEFFHRVDDPQIQLHVYGSSDSSNWSILKSSNVENPLYEETASSTSNPLYEKISATIRPPDTAAPYFVRFAGSM